MENNHFFYYRKDKQVFKHVPAMSSRELSEKEVDEIKKNNVDIHDVIYLRGAMGVKIDNTFYPISANFEFTGTMENDLQILPRTLGDINQDNLLSQNPESQWMVYPNPEQSKEKLPLMSELSQNLVLGPDDVMIVDNKCRVDHELLFSLDKYSQRIHYSARGRYFVFDGADGVGKTTWLKQFKTFLENRGYEVVLVREPGETIAGKILRERILTSDLGPDTNLELFIADRILTQEQVIKPALDAGKIVLSDRSLLSTIVYQGLPNNRHDEVITRHKELTNFLFPTLGFVCLLDYETCQARLNKRTGASTSVDENNHFDNHQEQEKRQRHKYYEDAKNWAPFPITFLRFDIPTHVINQEALFQIEKVISKSKYYPKT